MKSRRLLITLLIAVLHLAVALAAPALSAAGQTNRRNSAQNKNRKPSTPAAKADSASDAAPDTRGLKVQQINTGVTLEGRGKLWAVVVGVSRYKNLAPDVQLQFPSR